MQHRSGTLRERLHGYTRQTLGAGGSINEAVSLPILLYFQGVTAFLCRVSFPIDLNPWV